MNFDEVNDPKAPPHSGEAGAFPCTSLQERLWALHAKGGPQGLNVAMRWLVTGTLSHAAAQGALQALIQRHEILRTSFRVIDGRLAQIISPTCPFKLRDIDLSFLSGDEATARAEEIARTEALEPIDPGQAPLMRATLLRFGADRAALLLTFHAMAVDGWSTGLLVNEFRAAANAIDVGAAPDISEPEIQFADYALWEKELLASDALDEARTYWKRRLKDATGTAVPPDHLPPGRRTGSSHIKSLLLEPDVSRTIDAFARQQNVTLFSLAAAALALMLRRVTGNAEIVVGSQVANREEPTAESVVGPAVNSITLCLPVDDNGGLHAFVRSTADSVLEALRYQRLPFEIAETFAPRRDGMPLHAINFVVHRSYSGTTETEREGGGRFNLVSLPSYSSGTAWPLNFYMIGRDEGWRLSCEADADLYESGTVRRLLDAWRLCFEALATSADGRLADCPALQAIAPHAGEKATLIPFHNPARQVVRFHEAGSSTPVIVLNNVSVYYPLARQLGENRPFIDIQLYHPTGPLELPPCDFDAFAAYALRFIRWAQPKGPYILGGHCVYGVLAFEVARQLQRMGEKVLLVALFDSWAPGYREDMSPHDQKLRKRQLSMNTYAERLSQYRRGEIGLNEIARKPILRRLGLIKPDPEPEKLPYQWFDDYLRAAAARYRPTPYDGEVIIFRSEETLRGRLFDERMGWGPLVAGDLKKVEVSSAHLDMFREQPAAHIAAVMRAALAAKEDR
jgi:thioesterase domain-containing protein